MLFFRAPPPLLLQEYVKNPSPMSTWNQQFFDYAERGCLPLAIHVLSEEQHKPTTGGYPYLTIIMMVPDDSDRL